MKVTRRDVLKIAAAAPSLGASNVQRSLPPIVTSGGIRLYPTAKVTLDSAGKALPPWWTTEPVYGWNLPKVNSSGQLLIPSVVSLGATLDPDGETMFQDTRNTPFYGPFTRGYFQFSTPPLRGPQTLDGVVSAAIHAVEYHRRIDAVFALQVVVHDPGTAVRGVALPVTRDALEFPLDNPPKSRAAQNWPLNPVECQDGDIIAVNVGIYADNQTNSLAYGVGFSLYASQSIDISRLDDPQVANTWVEFSAPLTFQLP